MPQDHLCVSIACHIVIPGGLLDHGGRSWFGRLDLVRARVRVHGPVFADPVVRIGAYFCPYILFSHDLSIRRSIWLVMYPVRMRCPPAH